MKQIMKEFIQNDSVKLGLIWAISIVIITGMVTTCTMIKGSL